MLSVLILTKNSERYIYYVLKKVIKIADEIIIIDGGSTDNTISILKNFPVKIFYKPFRGFGEDRTFALSKASGDWICFIDSDEILTNELIQELSTIINSSIYDIIYFNTLTFFGKKIMKCWSGPRLKLFRKGYVQFSMQSLVHENVKLKTPAKKKIHNKALYTSLFCQLASRALE
jgi:glycosyltransferase involved in cell wall biosynthesis